MICSFLLIYTNGIYRLKLEVFFKENMWLSVFNLSLLSKIYADFIL